MKKLLFTAAIFLLALSSGLARTWTSAEGDKTFEGDLRSYDPETKIVSVVVGGRALTFTEDKLSAGDIEFLKENANNETTVSPAEAAAESKVGKKVTKAKLQRLDGERFKRAELEKAPEYYILYYSASW